MVRFSVYLDRHVFVMLSNEAPYTVMSRFKGKKFCPFTVDPFSEGNKNNFKSINVINISIFVICWFSLHSAAIISNSIKNKYELSKTSGLNKHTMNIKSNTRLTDLNFLEVNMTYISFVCVEFLQLCQPNGVMSSTVSLPNHTFTGQAWSSKH